jgi:hypothetical protein
MLSLDAVPDAVPMPLLGVNLSSMGLKPISGVELKGQFMNCPYHRPGSPEMSLDSK